MLPLDVAHIITSTTITASAVVIIVVFIQSLGFMSPTVNISSTN